MFKFKPMKKDLLPLGILLGLALTFCTVAFGQDAQKPLENTKAPVAASTPTPSLALTEPEKRFIKLLSDRIAPVQRDLQAAWQGILATEDEKEALNWWLKARLLDLKSKEINKEFNEWFEKVKVQHNCLDCTLNNLTLVRPEAKPEAKPEAPKKP